MASIVSDNPTLENNNTAYGYEHKRLFYLHDLEDWKVHHDDTDVRGWDVKLGTNQKVGEIENLIVDKAAEMVRYLEVTGDSDFYNDYRDNGYYLDRDSDRVFDADHDEHFIVPIGMARLDHSNRCVIVEGVQAEVFGKVPRYRRGSELLPSYEVRTVDFYNDYTPDHAKGYDRNRYSNFDDSKYRSLDDSFYKSGYFNSDRYYNRHEEAITSKGL